MRVKWDHRNALTAIGLQFVKKLEMSQMKKQIEVLLTFMPDEILYLPMEELDKVHRFVGVLLFADVSGFTPLTEKYNKTGKGGIYRLTATLNAYIGAIVEVIYYFGGDVLKFSGDALLALWKAKTDVCLYEVIHEVIVCALFIQKTLGFFETEFSVLLKVKLAISCGNLTMSVIGDEKFKHYVIIGQAVSDVKAAEHVSVSGDVVVSPSAWGHLAEEGYDFTYAPGRNVKVWKCLYKSRQKDKQLDYEEKCRVIQNLCEQHIELRNTLHENRKFNENVTDSYLIDKFVQSLPPRKTAKMAVQRWIVNELSPFIIKPVLEQVEKKQSLQYLTEMREVTIQFINIVPSSYEENELIIMIDRAYKIVCNIVASLLGVVNKVSLFDKDAMMLVLFGLKGIKHELESQNALKSAYRIRKEIVNLRNVESVSVGVTYGFVYCGVVGHPLRKEYTVIGGPVNKAARIMCAYEHKVTCDHETYANSKLPSTYFQLQSAFKLKGIESAGHIFEYNEEFEEGCDGSDRKVPLLGRQEELEYVRDVIAGNYSYSGVLLRAESKSGKTSFLEHCYDDCVHEDYLVAFVALCGGVKRPYNCVSSIYRQLFDRIGAIESSEVDLDSFRRNLWDFNEIIQEKLIPLQNEIVNRKKSILDMFSKICAVKPTVVFIDNAQYIDSRSFEIINETLKMGKLKLVSAGTFEKNTWDTLWQFSLSDRVKIVDLDPLESEYIAPLICQFLKVFGVPKKLCNLVDRTCEGRPGWIQSCLLKLVNNAGIKIEYVLPDIEMRDWMIFPKLDSSANSRLSYDASFFKKRQQVVPVIRMTKEEQAESEDLTLAAISLDLFDSFMPYEQLIIKTGAVLGESFTRSLLVIMLKYPNIQMFTKSLRHLFEEEVFECGSKYISSGGRYSRQTSCVCYLKFDEMEADADLPRYAFCKNLHFKNKTLRSVAYELIPANQRKELHLKTTEILENQNNSCPNCLRDNSSSIFQFRKYSVVTEEKTEECMSGYGADDIPTTIVKDIIRDSVKNDFEQNKKIALPNRKIWDPTVCFCLEILTRVYGDLVYHSGQAGHASKTIFFLYQNGLILSLLDELNDAVEVLKEASELCIRHIYEKTRVETSFARYLFAKTCSLLAEIYFSLNDWKAAKNYCMLTLRQFDVPMVSLYFASHLGMFRFDKIFASNRGKNDDHSNDSIAKCLSVIGRIFAAEGRWNLAVAVTSKSLDLVKRSNPNVELLCDVYSTALDVHGFKGHALICEQLAKNLGQELIRLYGNNLTSEIFAVAKLMFIVFQIKAKSGNVLVATRMGFRLFELNRLLHAYIFQVEIVPVLDFLLIQQKRVEDAVFAARYLKNMSRKYDNRGEVAYYAVCCVLLLETNFYLEPIEAIEAFAERYFWNVRGKNAFTSLENAVVVCLHSYYVRLEKTNKAATWKRLYSGDLDAVKTFYDVYNRLKFAETNLILKCRDLAAKTNDPDFSASRLSQQLENCGKHVKIWRIFTARYLHCKAYLKRLTSGKNKRSAELLKRADQEAEKTGNVLEKSWILLNGNCWKGDFSFSVKKEPVLWKYSNVYGPMQWSQMMFVLPLP